MTRGGERRAISIAVEDGRWTVDGAARPELDGCVDVDISLSPSTNTLPIRRLGLAVGESAEVAAAWVRFPGLTVEVLPQRYTRLDERRWRYESRRGSFVAELEVDADGVVTRYGDLWERVQG
ncbi:MAG TPA: putative glycolipid-binding domain-containing protein [Longimicrobium sp.]|nr:putative glycolipid-binding domain-containing protein [Longimicrobium sp.]